MPDEERDRFIQGFRWCPSSETIQPWEEDQDFGCNWCEVDLESLGPHLKLVLARYADAAWEQTERLRDHVNILRYAEIGEPEEVAAQMWTRYKMAAKSKDYPAVITNLVRGLAAVAIRAIANGKWARLEHDQAIKLRDTLTILVDRCGHREATLPRCEECEAAIDLLANVLLEDKPPEPPYGVDLSFMDPEADEAPETAQKGPGHDWGDWLPIASPHFEPGHSVAICHACGARKIKSAGGEELGPLNYCRRESQEAPTTPQQAPIAPEEAQRARGTSWQVWEPHESGEEWFWHTHPKTADQDAPMVICPGPEECPERERFYRPKAQEPVYGADGEPYVGYPEAAYAEGQDSGGCA